MAKIVIGLVGQMASGKEATKQYLVEKYAAKDCRFSTILRDVLFRLNVPNTRENMSTLSGSLRKAFGNDLLAKVIARDVAVRDADIVVIDGARRLDDIIYLKQLPNFVLVKIETNPEVRYERMKKGNENVGDSEKTYEQFLKEHEAETETTIIDVMKEAVYGINNNGSLEDLHRQIDEFIAKTLPKE